MIALGWPALRDVVWVGTTMITAAVVLWLIQRFGPKDPE